MRNYQLCVIVSDCYC